MLRKISVQNNQTTQNGAVIICTIVERIGTVEFTIPGLYGLLTVYKKGIPLRPILDVNNSS